MILQILGGLFHCHITFDMKDFENGAEMVKQLAQWSAVEKGVQHIHFLCFAQCIFTILVYILKFFVQNVEMTNYLLDEYRALCQVR